MWEIGGFFFKKVNAHKKIRDGGQTVVVAELGGSFFLNVMSWSFNVYINNYIILQNCAHILIRLL